MQLADDVASDVEGKRGLAHSQPSSEDVEAPAQETGAEAVPFRIAGRGASQALGMSILDGGEQAIEDRADGLDGRRRLPGEPPCYALLPLSDPGTPWEN